MNPVLDTLCCDHANFAKLLNIIEQQADVIDAGYAADLDILEKAVTYLEGYPARYHHPLEDALCARLQQKLPASDPGINHVQYQHTEIRRQLARFKRHMAGLKRGDVISRAKLAATAYAFVDAEWAHMELERSVLFPTAVKTLAAADWSYLESCVPGYEDPLFGGKVGAPLERLHQALLMCDNKIQTTNVLHRAAAS